MTKLTLPELQEAMPKEVRKRLTPEFVDYVNDMIDDPEIQESFRQNLLSFSSVMSQGKFRVTQYIDAVRYVSYKLMNEQNNVAYRKTFPDRWKKYKQDGVSDETIAKYVYSYNKSKLVNLVWEQASIPFYVYNQDARQRALNRQLYLMENAKSEKVQSDAANSVLTHTKPPEEAKIGLDVTVKDTGVLHDLKEISRRLAEQQVNAVSSGSMSAKDIAHQSLVIEGDVEDADYDNT